MPRSPKQWLCNSFPIKIQHLFNHAYIYLAYQKPLEMCIWGPGTCAPHCPVALNRKYEIVVCVERR